MLRYGSSNAGTHTANSLQYMSLNDDDDTFKSLLCRWRRINFNVTSPHHRYYNPIYCFQLCFLLQRGIRLNQRIETYFFLFNRIWREKLAKKFNRCDQTEVDVWCVNWPTGLKIQQQSTTTKCSIFNSDGERKKRLLLFLIIQFLWPYHPNVSASSLHTQTVSIE